MNEFTYLIEPPFLLTIIGLLLLLLVSLFYEYKTKLWYSKILDGSRNIVIVMDKECKIHYANKRFLLYTKEYFNITSLKVFNAQYRGIGDFFSDDEGYLHKLNEGKPWLDYILEHEDIVHKVKLAFGDQEYYFSVMASQIAKNYYNVIFTDITHDECKAQNLQHLTMTDTLTGIANRRAFEMRLAEDTIAAERYKYKLSMIILDIDHFKKINDTHGHDVGDEVLKEYTQLITSLLRKTDLFARIGGEEFVVLLSYTDVEEASRIAEKIRSRIESHKKVLPVTMSFGVTEYKEQEGVSSFFKRVDNALYDAKENGRNRVVVL